jgi:large subunit ribosomal protein L15
MQQHDLRPPKGSKKVRKRVGRGQAAGGGTTAGKGTKGQKARAGGGVAPYFEGGQLPLVRRLPYRRGFTNPFRKEYRPINLSDLQSLSGEVGPAELAAVGLIRHENEPYKILGFGEIGVALTIRAHRFSASAREKIEAAGGTAEQLGAAE